MGSLSRKAAAWIPLAGMLAVGLTAGMAAMVVAPAICHAQTPGQTSLSADQAQAVGQALTAALANVNGQIFANAEERNEAFATAISSVTVQMVAAYGPNTAGAIASIVIALSAGAGVPDTATGTGLGRGAVAVYAGSASGAEAMALTVVNEGTPAMAAAFAAAVLAAGGPQALADFLMRQPTATGSTTGGGPVTINGGANQFGGGGGRMPCSNPSCT